MALYWIIAVSFAGGLMSLILASIIFKNANAALANNLVSLAVGTLLAASFLEIIPHAMEASNNNFHDISFTVLIGILILFILEKLIMIPPTQLTSKKNVSLFYADWKVDYEGVIEKENKIFPKYIELNKNKITLKIYIIKWKS